MTGQNNDSGIDKTNKKMTGKKPAKKIRKGSLNLLLLGVSSVLVAIITTSVSLLVYHNSGDIYLDRSRPGYLPDEAEIESDNSDENYDFAKSGKINAEVLKEYLEKIGIEVKAIDAYDKPFSADALSNERLGIPTE